jgi:hypothetical protein
MDQLSMDTANRNDLVWAPGFKGFWIGWTTTESTQIKELGLTTLPIRVDISIP